MEKQSIVWTVLPNGLNEAGNALRFSLFVSPRLESTASPATLGPFDDFMDWPAAVSGAVFSLEFRNGPTVEAVPTRSALESELWTAIFKSDTRVKNFKFTDLKDRPIRSYPHKSVYEWIKEKYQQVAVAKPTVLPEAEYLADTLQPIIFYDPPLPVGRPYSENRMLIRGETVQRSPGRTYTRMQSNFTHVQLRGLPKQLKGGLQLSADLDMKFLTQDPTVQVKESTIAALQSIYSDLQESKYVKSDSGSRSGQFSQVTKDFLQVSLFHRPLQASIVQISEPAFDFHEALASLSEYPELMRRLGLVLDFEIPTGGNIPATGDVRAVVNWTPQTTTTNNRPWTRYEISNRDFYPRPKRGSDIKNRMLDLSRSHYHLVNLDLDGSALKLMNLASTLLHYTEPKQKEPQHLASTDPVAVATMAPTMDFATAVQIEEAGLPALRTSGIVLAKTGLAPALVSRFLQSAQFNLKATTGKDHEVVLDADDLVAGYRLDIWDSQSSEWHSVCGRNGIYRIPDAGITREYQDEGYIQIGVTGGIDEEGDEDSDSDDKPLYTAEALTSWDGWSKCAPAPWKTIMQGDPPDPDPAKDDAVQRYESTAQTDYGLATDFRVPQGTLPRLRYGTTYRMRLRVVDLAGNSLKLEDPPPGDFSTASEAIAYKRFEPLATPFVIPRSNIKPGESVENVVIRSNFNMTPEEYSELFPPAAGASFEYPSERHLAPPKTDQRTAEKYKRFDLPNGRMDKNAYALITSNDGYFEPFDPNDKVNRMKAIHPEESLDIPYLPDVARGVTFRGLPGNSSSQLTKIDFGPAEDWPDLRSFRVRLVEGTGAPEGPVEEGGVKVVTVKLPKASLKKAYYSSYLDADELEQMAVWEWIEESNPSNLEQLRQYALNGLQWTQTPYRGMTFIHVTQQPLEEPVIEKLVPEKTLGATFALLEGRISVHGASTSQLDTHAEWEEPIDDVNLPGPKILQGQGLAFKDSIDADDTAVVFPEPPEKKKTYDKYLSPEVKQNEAINIIGGATARTKTAIRKVQSKQSGVKVQAKDQQIKADQVQTMMYVPQALSLVRLVDGRRRHEFGDTKYRKVRYHSIATSRFREYFLDLLPNAQPPTEGEDPRDVEQDTSRVLLTRTGPVKEIEILNSARPEMPKVLYVVPSFGWAREGSGDEITSTRVGGLRVYMERPWYSSGDGELLGVIVWPPVGGKKWIKDDNVGKFQYQGATDLKNAGGISGKDMAIGDKFAGVLDKTPQEVPNPLKPYVTQWGADPIWLSGRLYDLPKLEDFTERVATNGTVSLDELPQEGAKVGVAGHEVHYNRERGLWYADIAINPHGTYFPFIRLALCRFHPKSVEDAHISRVVLADFVQLTPDRTAVVASDRGDAQTLRVTVSGIAYRASAAGQGSSEVEVTVETKGGPEPDLAWIPAENTEPVRLERLSGGGSHLNDGVWSGTVALPRPRGSQPFRLVIREFELHVSDTPVRVEGAGSLKGGRRFASAFTGPSIQRRLVYADVIEV